MNNDTIRKKGYITNLITDMSIDWMETHGTRRSRSVCSFTTKPSTGIGYRKSKIFHFTKIKSFPLPENFHDDYEGRIAAASQEMGIAEDMDLIYDLKC